MNLYCRMRAVVTFTLLWCSLPVAFAADIHEHRLQLERPGVPAGNSGVAERLPLPGEQLWEARYHLEDADRAAAIVTSPDGTRVFVTGHSGASGSNDTWYSTIAYDVDSGQQLWAAQYAGPANHGNLPQDIAVSPDGGTVFVTGASSGTTGELFFRLDYATVAYDAETGDELWASRYDGPGGANDGAQSVVATADRVFVTGYSSLGGPDQSGTDDYATIAYDAQTGEELWVARYNGPAEGQDGASDLDISPDGGIVVVTGSSRGIDTESDYATVAYDADTGDELWVARYDGPASIGDNAIAVVIDPTGERVFVTGLDRGEEGAFPGDQSVMDYATVAYDLATGDELWVSRYDGPGNGTDNPRGIAVAPDGSAVYITGYSHGGDETFWDYATIAYDAATGEEIWLARYNNDHANAQDIGYAIAVTEDRVFVTGASLMQPAMPPHPAGDPDYATIAYHAETGEQLWVSHYGGFGDRDNAFAIATAPHPLGTRVIVTGESMGRGTSWDYATIAYVDIDPAVYPVLDFPLSEIDSVQAPGTVVTKHLTLGNPGGTSLQWAVFEDAEERGASGRATPVASVAAAAVSDTDDARLSTDTAVPRGDHGMTADWPEPAGEELLMSHSESTAIEPENSIACVNPISNSTHKTQYLRTFTLSDFGIQTGFEVSEVTFGIEHLRGGEQVLTVNLYALEEEPLTYQNMRLVGTASAVFEVQSLSLVTVPVSGQVRGGSTLVVEVVAPMGLIEIGFFIGSNSAGQSAPSYLSALRCGVPEPTDVAELGAPDMHIVMSVTGTPLPACAIPGRTAWVEVAPGAGTIAEHGQVPFAVTFDANGMAEGTHEAHLCIESNDPHQPWMMVPVTLSVDGDGPLLSIDPGAVDFGAVEVGDSSDPQTITLTNPGSETLQIESVDTPPISGPFAFVDGTCPFGPFGFNLEPDASCTLEFTFTPDAAGDFDAQIEITSTAPSSPDLVLLSGRGVADAPLLEVDPESFRVVLEQGETATRTLHLLNPGEQSLSWAIAFAANGSTCQPLPPVWLNANPVAGTIDGAGTAPVVITFATAELAADTYSGQLCVTSNAAGDQTIMVPVELVVIETPPDPIFHDRFEPAVD